MLEPSVVEFLRRDVVERFLRYVQIDTTADPKNPALSGPSSKQQWDLLNLLKQEVQELQLSDVILDPKGYLYATLPARSGVNGKPFGLLAHVDTSPDQPGAEVKPRLIESYNGQPITYPDDPGLRLSTGDSAELSNFIGDTIIVASGRTLLGADDKAGVAEIMSALAVFRRFPELTHGEIKLCFTRDEEIGRGVNEIDLSKLPQYCYTMDGSYPGELEAECFDAWHVELIFHGVGVHPGFAKDKLVNASTAAARLISQLPLRETPEHTTGREGFFHVINVEGGVDRCVVEMIIRDFEEDKNRARIDKIRALVAELEAALPKLRVDIKTNHTYENMREEISRHPMVMEYARNAIKAAGLELLERPIRGGTDGSRLSKLGHPTPNIFAGGMLFHSRREWIAVSSLMKATEVILNLAREWAAAK